MGNRVALCRNPPDITSAQSIREGLKPGTSSVSGSKNRSVIAAWKTVPSASQPVPFTAETPLSQSDCYILLHVFRQGSGEQVNTGSSERSSVKSLPSLLDYLTASAENLSSKASENVFGGWRNDSVFMKPDAGLDIVYDIYVWNGKSSHPLTKAAALTKSFELERWLITDSTHLIESLFVHSANTPITAMFQDDIPSLETGSERLASLLSNHLLRTLLTHRNAMSVPSEPFAQLVPLGKTEHYPVLGFPAPAPAPETSLPLKAPVIPSLPLQMTQPWDDPEISEGKRRIYKLQHFDKECSSITDLVYVGAATVAADKALLKQNGITHIANAAGLTCPNYFPDDFHYTTFYVADASHTDLLSMLFLFVSVCEEARQSGGRVFVHCHQGVSRSCSLAIGYLMWAQNMGFQEVFEFVRNRRGICSPNPGFIGQLMLWRQLLNEPLSTPRLYRISPHAVEAPLLLMGKSAKGAEALDPRFSYLLRVGDRVAIWTHPKCIAPTLSSAAADTLVRQLVQVGVCSKVVPERIVYGSEPAYFAPAVFGDEATAIAVEELVEFDMDAEMLTRATSSQGQLIVESVAATMNESIDSSESEPTKETSSFTPFLLTYPDLEELNMFDTGDLDEEAVFVLIDGDGNVRLWVGEDADLEGRDAEEVAEDATREVLKQYAGRLSSAPDVLVELQGEESDSFFDQFING